MKKFKEVIIKKKNQRKSKDKSNLMKKNFKEVSIINLSKDIITADLGFS
jgi:hypothetical protein